MKEAIAYIIRFMLGEHVPDEVARMVGYTSDASAFKDYRVVIIPSRFFDQDKFKRSVSLPLTPLREMEGLPVLYGDPVVERVGDTVVVHADFVAGAYFLLTRYEETQYPERIYPEMWDEHGRFSGYGSLPRRERFIDRPVVDEYGKLLRRWLNGSGVHIPEPAPSIGQVNLTHDVDVPFFGRSWRSVARRALAGGNPVEAIRGKYSPLDRDPYYTFPWMFERNRQLQLAAGESRSAALVFFRAGGRDRRDRPHYSLRNKDIGALHELCGMYGVKIGLHSSYQAGKDPSLILSEKRRLEQAFGVEIRHNRHHYLASRKPEDMEYLEKAGITDDYTMGYAGHAGFRLGTARPVRFINPVTCRVSGLTLHPLTVMDSTLYDRRYMNLTADRAEEYCLELFRRVRDVNGELTLLWHNTSAVKGQEGYARDLYARLTERIADYLG
ncbi:MAG: polysaccharide deacetylase family protein [Tannerella sp.]|jgi:hypothetical protein|nr:polysaccharide deacetylase family protein [Tannerella sp.]